MIPSVDANKVQEWADDDLGPIYAVLQKDPELEVTLVELANGIRAAYAAGYQLALTEADPLTIRDAMMRAAVLHLLIPIP